MTLKEIISKICEIRNQVEELESEATAIWEAGGEDAEEADNLSYDLAAIAAGLSELENPVED